VTVEGDLLYSKLKTGTFPDEHAIVQGVTDRFG